MPRAIHRPHAAGADQAFDDELAGELAADEILGRAARFDVARA